MSNFSQFYNSWPMCLGTRVELSLSWSLKSHYYLIQVQSKQLLSACCNTLQIGVMRELCDSRQTNKEGDLDKSV